MESLRRLAPATASWRQPRMMERVFELVVADEVVGTLEFVSVFGSLVRVETADGVWTFKRGGFLKPHVTVRREGSDENIATMHMTWGGGGALETSDKAAIIWSHTSFWHTRWMFSMADGTPLMHFSPDNSFFKPGALIEIEPMGQASPHLTMLASLGWFLMLLMAQDSSAAAVTAVG